MDVLPELYVGWTVGVTFIVLFVVASFIADVIDRKNK